MKKLSIVYLAGVLLFAACGDSNSSTVGEWNSEESTEQTEHNEGNVAGKHEGTMEQNGSDSTLSGEGAAGMGADTSANAGGSEPR